MMNIRLFLLVVSACLSSISFAQEQRRTYAIEGYRPVVLPDYQIVADNPFPLSADEKENLLDSMKQICRAYLEKFPQHNLDTWPKEARETYLRAKAAWIILQFQPDYYRAYAVPEIRRYEHGGGRPNYLLTYYYDRTKESNGSPLSLDFKMELAHVAIRVEDAQGLCLSLPILNEGDGSRGTNIYCSLNDEEEEWTSYPYIIWNKDYDWDSCVLFE